MSPPAVIGKPTLRAPASAVRAAARAAPTQKARLHPPRPSDVRCYLSPVPGRTREISVEELKEKRDRGEMPALLDVREPHEYAFSDLPGSIKVPLGTLPRSLEKIPKDRELVVYCRSGARSANAVQFLQQVGYEKAVNLAGGVNAWAERIDPTMRKY